MTKLKKSEARFLDAFEDGSLPEENFDHKAHVYAAWCALRRYGDPAGRERFVAALRRFVDIHGAQSKYHDTITRAFLQIIADRSRDTAGWQTFRRSHAALVGHGMEELLKHYSRDLLFSDEARTGFVDPDLHPLPGQNHRREPRAGKGAGR